MASRRARRRAIKRAAVLVRERLPFLARKPQHEAFSGAFRPGGVRREG